MVRDIIRANSYFDGEKEVTGGPWLICRDRGRIAAICHADADTETRPPNFGRLEVPVRTAGFAMPGLVEAHAHLFLDGGTLDTTQRAQYLKSDSAQMLATAKANLGDSLSAGITLVRDAGDRHGINHRIRALSQADPTLPHVRSPGLGLRRKGRYGSFMAHEIDAADEIEPMVNRIADEGADDCKILLTGIIDFATGTVKGEPQFSAAEMRAITQAARRRGLPTFAHCSGEAGLDIATSSGLESVEHGFFMTEDVLVRMAEQQIAWVPTFAPVHFQWAEPSWCGWDDTARAGMRTILDHHAKMLVRGQTLGVPICAGSDAGSHGVPHGQGLLDELSLMLQAGLSMREVLCSATLTPRRTWGEPVQKIRVGDSPDLALFAASPFENPSNLRLCQQVLLPETPETGGIDFHPEMTRAGA